MADGTVTVLGALGGLVIGHYLTRSWQFKQWQMENRKSEYRELLSALSAGYQAVNMYYRVTTTEGRENCARTQAATAACIADRIFIADEVARLKVMRRWRSMLSAGAEGGFGFPSPETQQAFERLRADIVASAHKTSTENDIFHIPDDWDA